MEGDQYDVVVTYAAEDAAWAKGYLIDALERAGSRVLDTTAIVPGSVMLEELERGIAQSARTVIVLSDAYVRHGQRLIEMLAQHLSLVTDKRRLVVVQIEQNVDAPLLLQALVPIDATDRATWHQAVEQLCALLHRKPPRGASTPMCPYPGMRPFGIATEPATDRRFFFGRESEAEEIVRGFDSNRDSAIRFCLIVGPSGVGKSSLARVGVPAALDHSPRFGASAWQCRVVRLGADPLDALHAARASLDVTAPEQAGRRTPERLIIVDQLEELWALRSCDVGDFCRDLVSKAGEPHTYVLATLRADFSDSLMSTPAIWDVARVNRLEVTPLRDRPLREAIAAPARVAGVHVERALTERLVAEAEDQPGSLPFLQEVLVALWGRLDGRLMSLASYEDYTAESAHVLGLDRMASGLEIALARQAEIVLSALGDTDAATARRILVRLVQLGDGTADTRRRVPVAELRGLADEMTLERVRGALQDGRLVTASGGADGATLELSHDALLRGWPAFAKLIDASRSEEATRRRLLVEAEEWSAWVARGHPTSALLDGPRLAEAEAFIDRPDVERLGVEDAIVAFVAASRAEADRGEREQLRVAEDLARQRLRTVRLLIGAVAVVTVLALVAGFALIDALRARDRAAASLHDADLARGEAEAAASRAERQAKLAEARGLASDAQVLANEFPDLAALLATEAYLREDTDPAMAAGLFGVIRARPDLIATLRPPRDDYVAAAFTNDTELFAARPGAIDRWRVGENKPKETLPIEASDLATDGTGALLAVVTPDGGVAIHDLTSGTVTNLPSQPPATAVDLSLRDGRSLAINRADGTVEVVDTRSGLTTSRMAVPGPVAISPDGTRLASAYMASPSLPNGAAESGEATIAVVTLPASELVLSIPPVSPDLSRSGVGAVAFTADGTGVEVIHDDGSIDRFSLPPEGPSGGQGASIATAMVRHRPLEIPQLTTQLNGAIAAPPYLAVAPGGRYFALVASTIVIRSFDKLGALAAGPILTGDTLAFSSPVGELSADGSRWLISSLDGAVTQVYDREGQSIGPIIYGFGGFSDTSTTRLFVGRLVPDGSGRVELWAADATTGAPLAAPIVAPGVPIPFATDVGRHGLLVKWSAQSIALMDTSSDSIVPHEFDVGVAPENLALGPPGTPAIVIADGRALLLRLTDGMIVDDDLLDGRGSASASAISPDGSTAAIGLSTGAVVMIDLMTTRVSEQEYRPFSGNVEQIFFSPDGQRLAVGSEAEVALIDLRVGRTIGRSIAAELGLTQPFGQSGKIVVSIDDEPRAGVAVIDLTPTRWASIACEIAGRDLSHQEWETYLPDDAPYRSTCAALG